MRRFCSLSLLLVLLAAGCRSASAQSASSTPPAYRLVYLIHGDANYTYHTAEGYPRQADEQVLKEAKKVANNATNGEVFIFHQRPEKKILWLFPQKDRQFLYYKNGRLINDQRYSPGSNQQPFATEKKLLSRYKESADTASQRKIMLYFGHEIPASDHSYHLSRPKANFNRDIFVQGIRSFLASPSDRFNLTVLSTCDNGNPGMVQALSPYTDYILASPQNLHLSHITTENLGSMLDNSGFSSFQVADSLADQTYRRLSSFLQTAVSLSLYDTRTVSTYLPAFNRSYINHLSQQSVATANRDNIDCATLSFFNSAYTKGVKTWYKPPRFGQKKNVSTYSGWGCKPKKE